MTKEIKFRGLTHDTKEIKIGYYYKGVTNNNPLCLGDCKITHAIMEQGTMRHCPEETICEYTGLQDKIGNNLYSNDKIKFVNGLGIEDISNIVWYKVGGWGIEDREILLSELFEWIDESKKELGQYLNVELLLPKDINE